MLLLTPIYKFDINNILLDEKTKNNVINDSSFYRIFFSDELATFNALYLLFELKNVKVEKYFDKIKCLFNYKENETIINEIISIEKKILDKCNFTVMNYPVNRIEDQLKNNFIKINESNVDIKKYNTKRFILKISGIWSTNPNMGLTFRFFLK